METLSINLEEKLADKFYFHCQKKGVVKSAILEKLIIEYLEYGLREYPSTSLPKTTHPIDKKGVNV